MIRLVIFYGEVGLWSLMKLVIFAFTAPVSFKPSRGVGGS